MLLVSVYYYYKSNFDFVKMQIDGGRGVLRGFLEAVLRVPDGIKDWSWIGEDLLVLLVVKSCTEGAGEEKEESSRLKL